MVIDHEFPRAQNWPLDPPSVIRFSPDRSSGLVTFSNMPFFLPQEQLLLVPRSRPCYWACHPKKCGSSLAGNHYQWWLKWYHLISLIKISIGWKSSRSQYGWLICVSPQTRHAGWRFLCPKTMVLESRITLGGGKNRVVVQAEVQPWSCCCLLICVCVFLSFFLSFLVLRPWWSLGF